MEEARSSFGRISSFSLLPWICEYRQRAQKFFIFRQRTPRLEDDSALSRDKVAMFSFCRFIESPADLPLRAEVYQNLSDITRLDRE